MNNIIELALLSTASTVSNGFLDLYDNEPINIKMSIADVSDISKRSAPYTQSFTVPGTKNNNQLLNSIFNIGSDSSFDPRKKSSSYLTANSIPVMSNGVFQLTGIVIDENKKIDYQATIFSESQDLFQSIGDAYLEDIDFSDLNHTWSYSSITNSWTGTNNSYFYPLIDYGYDLNLTDMQNSGVSINQMFAALQVKTIVDRIFSAAGFSYNSTFFNSNYFKNLYIPYTGNLSLTETPEFAFDRSFRAQMSSNLSGLQFADFTINPPIQLPFSDDSTGPNFDNGGLYNNATYIYSSDTYSIQSFHVNLDYEIDIPSGITSYTLYNEVDFYRSTHTQPFFSDVQTITPNTRTQALFSTPDLNGAIGTPLEPCKPGELFYIKYYFSFIYNGIPQTTPLTLYFDNTYFYNIVSTQALPGQSLEFNAFVPKKIKQKDFLNSLILMNNLYLDPSKDNEKQIYIEPRDTYYSANTVTKNWTSKLDLKVPINEKLVSEQQNKRLIFSYKEDADYYNADYKSATNKIFGDYYFNIDNEFVVGGKKIEPIFSPTPSVAVMYSSIGTTSANEFVIPKIGKIDSNKQFGATNFNIRILQRNQAKLLTLNSGDTWKLSGITQTKYPYLGMLNHPSSGNTDLGFGTVDYEYYTLPSITNNNLVNRFWRTYLEQIADKDSKIITCNMYLTPEDIQDFKFSDSIFIDGLTEDGGHYFIVNSIQYSPTSNGTSKVELIKMKEKFVQLDSSSSINNNGTLPVDVISVGGVRSYSTRTLTIGDNSTIGERSKNSFLIGDSSIIEGGSPRSMIIGDNSAIKAGTTNAFVFGDNISATTANTTYVPNLKISPGGTINGSSIESITGGTLWSASTGPNSIIQNNLSGNSAVGDSSFVIGAFNTATTIYSSVIGGQFNLASGTFASVIGGGANSSTNQGSFIGGGGNSLASGAQSAIVGGAVNSATTDYSFIGGGEYNKTLGNDSAIIAGRSNISFGFRSFVGGGDTNITSGSSSSVVGGNLNISEGDYSSVIGGQQNKITGTNSVIIGGISITGTSNNTVYIPDFVIKKSSAVPTSSADAVGEPGSITWDNNYIYFKNGVTGWLRISGQTF